MPHTVVLYNKCIVAAAYNVHNLVGENGKNSFFEMYYFSNGDKMAKIILFKISRLKQELKGEMMHHKSQPDFVLIYNKYYVLPSVPH